MRSPQDGLLGEVEPQIVHLPPDVHSLAAAEEAIELADSYGVCRGNPLDDSQRFTLRAGLGERADGSWAASTVADFEPRQNGKNDTCAARELAGLVLFGERLIIHTAHEFATANESFLRLVAVFEAHDDLRKRVARVRYANGEQGIELLNGARLKYKARTGGSGRGFAEADLIVYDESQHLQPEHLAASGPARLANPNSQSWYLGSGGLATSRVAWRMRRRALEGDAGRFAYVEHTAERVSLVDGRVVQEPPADLMDRAAWARANPAYGRRVSDESFLALLGELGPELWARECLCLWDPEPDAADSVIPAVKWSACRNERSGPVDQVDFALDVSPNRDAVCFAVAAQGALGGVHVEVVRHGPHPGAKALCDEAKRLQATHGGSMTLVKGSPAWSLKDDLERAGVRVREVEAAEYVQSCGDFFDAVMDGEVTHLGQTELDDAVRGAERKWSGDAWYWARRTSVSDITPLVAVTIARWAHLHGAPALSVW